MYEFNIHDTWLGIQETVDGYVIYQLGPNGAAVQRYHYSENGTWSVSQLTIRGFHDRANSDLERYFDEAREMLDQQNAENA